ncbi:MAG: hypothetical protein ACI9LN_003499 [Saprospiraceae bacterium]|jgi:hypothetical protein
MAQVIESFVLIALNELVIQKNKEINIINSE